MAGAWTMTDEGEFVLNEPYKSKLELAKALATEAWVDVMMDFVANETGYDAEQLLEEFSRRSTVGAMPPIEIVNSFVIEALEGTLFELDAR